MPPVNPKATQQAKNLLCYLQTQYGNHVLSGQQETSWAGNPETDVNYIYASTNKYPVVLGGDYLYSNGTTTRAQAWWNAGGIPMICYHMGAPPLSDSYANAMSAAGGGINAVLTPGTASYASFIQKLDYAAGELQKLQAANVAVLWRPFHEAGGTWFWWSKEGGAQYVRLWTFMYNYFTNTKGLNNLIWLHPYNGSPQSAFYPGKAIVDVAGADTY
ncbi:MAG: glycoside hydrolase family 26 protein, partial [Myxococcota bacterium]|nr:glycoside hydrolase family 26 protein [Myxococcota bacterium]